MKNDDGTPFDWTAERTYDTTRGDRIALVRNGGSRLARVYALGPADSAGIRRPSPRTNSLRLGNMQMAEGFGVTLDVGGVPERFPSVEQAYIAGCFSDRTDGWNVRVQRLVQADRDGLVAKKHWRRGLCAPTDKDLPPDLRAERAALYAEAPDRIRADWGEPWHYEWMLWLFWRKMECNPAFAARVRAIPRSHAIVEAAGPGNSSPDWGCAETPKGSGIWKGRNHFGVIAGECRDAIRRIREDGVPRIDWEELNRRAIHLFGARLIFAPPRPIPWEPSARQRELLRRAGRSTSAAKAAAARRNGAKGGRPRGGTSARAEVTRTECRR